MSDTYYVYPTPTTNGTVPTRITMWQSPPPARTYDLDEWLVRSKQVRKRHPLDPHGVCMSCNDHKIGHWQWVPWEPSDGDA